MKNRGESPDFVAYGDAAPFGRGTSQSAFG